MKPVKQTKLAPDEANCYAACLASVLEVAIDDVPQPAPEELADAQGWARYEARVAVFLRARGLYAVGAPHRSGAHRPPGYAILTGESPRSERLHSVVTLDGEIIFDPYPGASKPLGAWHDWTVFMALDPSKSAVKVEQNNGN